MRVTSLKPYQHNGHQYRTGAVIDMDDSAGMNLCQQRLARPSVEDVARLIRGKRLVLPSTVADIEIVTRRH